MSQMHDVSKKYQMLLCSNDHQSEEWENVLVEYTLVIYVNGKRYVNLICTHKNLYELVLGNLFSEGIIRGIHEIESININEQEGKAFVGLKTNDVFKDVIHATEGIRTVTTACGKQHSISYYLFHDFGLEPLKDEFVISYSKILSWMSEFQQSSEIYKLTRGIHSCGLYSEEKTLYLMEDIGRHNAVDKVLGRAIVEKIDLSKTMMITSGRVPSDMLTKVIKAKIPIIVARSVATDVAIEMANIYNVTLIGYARGIRMNVYTKAERILFNELL